MRANLIIRKKSYKNVFNTFMFRFQQYEHKLTNFSIKSYLENVGKFFSRSTNQNKLTKFAIFVFLPILRSCQFSFFWQKECQSTLFWQKICQNHLVVGRQNPRFCQKYFHFLEKSKCPKLPKPPGRWQTKSKVLPEIFSFFDKKKCQSTVFFAKKNAKTTRSLVNKIQGLTRNIFVFWKKKKSIHFFRKKIAKTTGSLVDKIQGFARNCQFFCLVKSSKKQN